MDVAILADHRLLTCKSRGCCDGHTPCVGCGHIPYHGAVVMSAERALANDGGVGGGGEGKVSRRGNQTDNYTLQISDSYEPLLQGGHFAPVINAECAATSL